MLNFKRLFDDTAEAESILKDFKNYDLGQIAELIMPVLIHESLRNVFYSSLSDIRCIPILWLKKTT